MRIIHTSKSGKWVRNGTTLEFRSKGRKIVYRRNKRRWIPVYDSSKARTPSVPGIVRKEEYRDFLRTSLQSWWYSGRMPLDCKGKVAHALKKNKIDELEAANMLKRSL